MTDALLVFLVVWLVSGGTTALVMARKGFDRRAWIALGLAFGPFAGFLAREDVRRVVGLPPHELHRGRGGQGDIAVLVGLDGSAEARGALRQAVGLLGDRIGQLTLAAVIDRDAAVVGDQDAAVVELARAEGMYEELEPSTVILSGAPAEALMDHCASTGHQLLVVGRRGHGASRLLLGSVATTLARRSDVPVLVGGAPVQTSPREPGRERVGRRA